MAGVHAKKGPSGAERLHACPGALALIETLPPEDRRGSNAASQLGTAAHFLLEKCLTERKPPSSFEGRIIVLLGDKEDGSMLKVGAKTPKPGTTFFIVDDDMIQGVTLAYDYVLRRLEELGDATLLLESKTNPVPDRDDTWGTADVTIDVFLDILEVVDYKNGFGLVEHKDNPQLLSYLAGRAHDTQWSHDRYRITVVQPNAHHEEGRIRSFDIDREDLKAFVDKHRAAAELADHASDTLADECVGNPNAPFSIVATVDGETVPVEMPWSEAFLKAGDHCDYCDASLICPAKKAMIKANAGIDFDEDPPEAPQSLTPAEAAKVLEWSGYVMQHIRLARIVEQRELSMGRPLPGRKVVRQKPRGRRWKPGIGSAYEVASALVKAGYISDNERTMLFTEPELLSGPKVEKLIPAKKRKEFSSEFLELPPGKLVSAPLSDPRPAVTVSPGDDFDSPEEERDPDA